MDFSFRSYLHIIYGVSKGSIYGHQLFSLDLYSMRYGNFGTLEILLMKPLPLKEDQHLISHENLEIIAEEIIQPFSFNNLKANASICHLFISSYQPVSVNVRCSVFAFALLQTCFLFVLTKENVMTCNRPFDSLT